MPLGRRGRLRHPRDDRPRRPGHRPGRRDRPGDERRAAAQRHALRPPGDPPRRRPTRSSTRGRRRSTCAGRSSASWPATRSSATCPTTAGPSPTRCARRPIAIVFEATTDHGRLADVRARASCRRPTDRPVRILTHCNTGPLACGQYGTALGVVQAAHHAGRPVHVWVDETRPYLQGARLTAWELAQAGVPHTLLPDVAAGHLMARGEVDVILVGADRVAANGDTANKVGTYTLAVLAARHGIPFYVCAPTSSVDLATADRRRHRDRGAQRRRGPRPSAASASRRPTPTVRNPAFDVTPAELITGIVTEEGVVRPPFEAGLAAADRARPAPAGRRCRASTRSAPPTPRAGTRPRP